LKGLLSTYKTESPVKELQAVIELAKTEDYSACRQLITSLLPSLERLIEQINQLATADS
jgi:hypothetical protein